MAMDKERLMSYFQTHYLSRQEVLFKLPLNVSIDSFWNELLSRRRARATVLPLNNATGMKAREHPLYRILYRQANPEMSSFSFWEAMMTHLLLWGNAFAQIVRDGKNGVLGIYPLLPENVEIDRQNGGELYYIYHAYTDEVPGENK